MKCSPKKKLMIIAGGSGGHIIPAISFCKDFKETRQDFSEIIFITTKGRSAVELIPQEFGPIFLEVKRTIPGILKLIFNCVILINKIKPDIVFGFGGYFSVPFIILQKLSGKKAFIHEQNVMPGKANRVLKFFADKIIISFLTSEKYFSGCKKKTFLAKYPLRKTMQPVKKEDALRFFGLDNGRFTFLVLGGSQGARSINEKFVEALKSNKDFSSSQVIHISGQVDFDKVEKAYSEFFIKSKVFAFLPQMHYAYSAADLVISRSGAGCVNEIIRFGLPSVLIPYPYAGAHQMYNAKVLAERGAAILMEDSKISSGLLGGLLSILMADEMRRKTMSSLAASLYESSENLEIADLIN